MRVRRLSAAEDEFLNSVAFYLGESPQAAERFVNEVESAVEELSRDPNLYPVYEDIVRRKVLNAFPFSIYYFIENDEVVIVAIMHNKRRPKYWRKRL